MKSTVQDVMTTHVAAVRQKASFHTVAELLIEKGVSGMPVLDDDGRVVGVVSETDLLAKEEFKQCYYGDEYRPPLRARIRHAAGAEGSRHRKSAGETAGDLMTSPAHVITAEASIVTAARHMDRHGVKRLPVVDARGRLVGIVSRRDLIKVFLRTDRDLLPLVRAAVHADELGIGVSVSGGVVTLRGAFPERSQPGMAIRLAESVDGVVGVHHRIP
ncbi:CBS domain-containing protein [Nonomuraea zeae]|uniref:CBS domain-containing protein n=1 Tax=Nonomuraea zeae TaxID=1642303 RepID=A0A5S4FGT8_9ACTN|nr:CBS domain-containing protein [Nonomuraea zeae]TMR18648.1 CBS domain-containing protein [Nonomuraea zeae]